MLRKTIFFFCLFTSFITLTGSESGKNRAEASPLVVLTRQRNEELFAKLIDNAVAKANITGKRRMQFFNEFERFKQLKKYRAVVSSSNMPLRKAVIKGYIAEWIARYPEATVVSTPVIIKNLIAAQDELSALKEARIPVSTYKEKFLRMMLESLPAVPVALIQEYSYISNEYFVPVMCESPFGFQHKPHLNPHLHLFVPNKNGVLDHHRFYLTKSKIFASDSAPEYPHTWNSSAQSLFRGMITERYGPYAIVNLESASERSIYKEFDRICGVPQATVYWLSCLLRMKTRRITVDSEEYQKATENSLVMLDPHFLTMQDFGIHIKDIYSKLKNALHKPEFQKLHAVSERSRVEAFVKACEQSQVIELLEKTEPGFTSVLFYEESRASAGFSGYSSRYKARRGSQYIS